MVAPVVVVCPSSEATRLTNLLDHYYRPGGQTTGLVHIAPIPDDKRSEAQYVTRRLRDVRKAIGEAHYLTWRVRLDAPRLGWQVELLSAVPPHEPPRRVASAVVRAVRPAYLASAQNAAQIRCPSTASHATRYRAVMEAIRERQAARGHKPPSCEEVADRISAERAGWDDD